MILFNLLEKKFSLDNIAKGLLKKDNTVVSYLELGINFRKGNVEKINSRFFAITKLLLLSDAFDVAYNTDSVFITVKNIDLLRDVYPLDQIIESFKCLIKKDLITYATYDKNADVIETDDDFILLYASYCLNNIIKNDSLLQLYVEALKNLEILPKLTVMLCNDALADVTVKAQDVKEIDDSEYEKGFGKLLMKNPDEFLTFSENDFKEEYIQLIPKLKVVYEIMPDDLMVAKAIVNEDVFSALFYGESGTGKSVACKLICEEIGLPVMTTINCTDNLDEFVLGKFIPSGNGFTFAESMFTKAIREGGAVIVEEINFARPELLSFLNSLLDFNGFVALDDGTTVKRHKNFKFFATMNVNYYGTRELNLALQNRFNIIKKSESISAEKIEKNLLRIDPNFGPFLKQTLQIYFEIKKYIENNGMDAVITPRTLENFVKLGKSMPYYDAACMTIFQVKINDDEMKNAIRALFNKVIWIK